MNQPLILSGPEEKMNSTVASDGKRSSVQKGEKKEKGNVQLNDLRCRDEHMITTLMLPQVVGFST